MCEYNRRTSDMHEFDEIGELIKQENDPKTRAILMVLQSINISLKENTKAVSDTDVELKALASDYRTRTAESEAMVNRGKGMWYILSAVLVVVQAGLIWLMLQSLDEVKGLHQMDNNLSTRITILESRK